MLAVTGALCGVLIALSEPPFGLWPLAWAGFAGLALLIPGRTAKVRAGIGFCAGVGQFVLGIWWVLEFSVPGYVALVVVSGFYIAVALLLIPARRPLGIVLAMPAVFVLAEWARDRFPLGGFPLGSSVLGQAVSPLAPSLRLGGSLLLDGETVLVGVALAGMVGVLRGLQARRAGTSSWTLPDRSLRREISLVVGLVALAVAIPVAGAVSPSGAGGSLSPLQVALVQGGGPRGTRAISTDPQTVFERHLQASSSLQPPLDLVVWPEGILQSQSAYTESADAAAVSALARRLQATVVVGVEQDVDPNRYLNMVTAWNPAGEVVATYVKNHLVPFGEYVPWRSVLSKVFNFSAVPYDGIPGHGPGLLPTPAGRLGVMISYEVFFDQRARGAVRAGGEVLVVPTNTASYRSTQVPTQELAAARLRAWETGRWVLQVTPTGYTGLVSPEGRVTARTTLGRQQVIHGTVPGRTGRTVYVVLGDTPVVALAGLVLVLAYLLVRPDLRRIPVLRGMRPW
jgi:apolipoprotein N-acyltransferase